MLTVLRRAAAAAVPGCLELAGAASLVAGVAMVSVPAALVVAGLLLVAAGYALSPPPPRGRRQ